MVCAFGYYGRTEEWNGFQFLVRSIPILRIFLTRMIDPCLKTTIWNDGLSGCTCSDPENKKEKNYSRKIFFHFILLLFTVS